MLILFLFFSLPICRNPNFYYRAATTKSKFSKEMLTATEISSVFVTASYICFPTNISVLQQNKRQLNSLPLVILIYSVFSGYPNY